MSSDLVTSSRGPYSISYGSSNNSWSEEVDEDKLWTYMEMTDPKVNRRKMTFNEAITRVMRRTFIYEVCLKAATRRHENGFTGYIIHLTQCGQRIEITEKIVDPEIMKDIQYIAQIWVKYIVFHWTTVNTFLPRVDDILDKWAIVKDEDICKCSVVCSYVNYNRI